MHGPYVGGKVRNMIKFILPLASVGDDDASVEDKSLDSESSDSEGDEINSEKDDGTDRSRSLGSVDSTSN